MELVANAIITYNDKVLMVKKRSSNGRPKTFWELPGGVMLRDDISIEHAAIRSVLEEVGVHIIHTGRWFSNNYKKIVNVVVSAELCDERDAYQLHPSPDIIECAWVPRNQVATFDATPLTKDRIDTIFH